MFVFSQNQLYLINISAFYILGSKFSVNIYESWISNFILNVKKFNLVIFCNEDSKKLLTKYINNNKNIKLIVWDFNQFYNYKYKENFISNFNNNYKQRMEIGQIYSDWKLNLLWCEKISFVKKVIEDKIFISDWYGWCDILENNIYYRRK